MLMCYYLLTPERWQPPKGEMGNTLAVDAIGRASGASPASKCTFPFSPITDSLLLLFLSGSAGCFSTCAPHLHGQCMIQSPGGTPSSSERQSELLRTMNPQVAAFISTHSFTNCSSFLSTCSLQVRLSFRSLFLLAPICVPVRYGPCLGAPLRLW